MPILRTCGTSLATALGNGARLDQADLFQLTTLQGAFYVWTSAGTNLTVFGQLYTSVAPHIERGKWNLTNTMEVPTLEVRILDTSKAAFGTGTLSLRTQIHNGLLDGASFRLQRLFLPAGTTDTSLGAIDIFTGDVGAVTLLGAQATIKVRGKSARLNVQAPRNVFQPGCLHTFCDTGCTLSKASFTHNFSVIGSSTRTILPISGGALSAQTKGGTLTMTSGANSGESRSIIDWDGFSTVTLVQPLSNVPAVGDTCTVFQGCDKTLATCTSTYSNALNFRGFPFIPPPNTAAPGQ